MAAAAGGWRRGKLKAQKENLRKYKVARGWQEHFYEEERRNLATILKLYDTDQSGYLEKNELPKMLEDYNLERLGRKGTPTEDDVTCLIHLCDWGDDGNISKHELKNALETWLAYMQHAERIYATLQKFDLSGTGKINHGELRPLLVEMNKGEDVPDDVLKWIWEQADVTNDGALNAFELARAVAVWYAWSDTEPKEQANSDAKLRTNMDGDSMPAKAVPPPTKSSACIVL
eukprot:gnl/MRDRNA2_/MRDRNA2_161563_c0_seq1.p1 gnl/MRDRNA2_/MRDRNA2_161563_c0~~gnl/MRDRNA2_/MRDRNA2_161563_c0_seq1.p1  ORF type:complete len:231 (+),score=51.97 gnl/MRDRNA2_/MRDRNA2_161563_c0_seq1:53-745(+)